MRLLPAASLMVALAAAGGLLVAGPAEIAGPEPAATRVSAATAWPSAKRADYDPVMPDGPLFTPLLFLDPATAVGTAPTPDAETVRLLVRDANGGQRLLRRLPLAGNPQFEVVTATAEHLVWTESNEAQPRVRIWIADRSGGPARLLTADTGHAIFYGTSHDLVVADGRVHWAAAPGGDKTTEIRSVPLTGGRVQVRVEPGKWAMSAWPWLVDENEGRLRNLATGRDTTVTTSGPETVTCGPAWCRVLVITTDTLARIDLMRPDGSARRRIAGGDVQAAVADVAVLDRFEILAEPGPDADVTGTAALVVYDVASGRTVEVAPAVDGAFTHGGMLWWSTGDDETITWHTLDLRTA